MFKNRLHSFIIQIKRARNNTDGFVGLHWESSNTDFFECFEYETKTFKLIRKSDVITQLELTELSKTQLRTRIVAQANKLVNEPYQWGGRSALNGSGFDCAGLVEAAYRSCNQKITCGVQGQFHQSIEIKPQNLQPGDLIFFYRNKFNTITVDHVIMYAGAMNNLIESCPIAGLVTKSQFYTQFKAMILECRNGDTFIVENELYYISFRSLL